MRRQRAATCEQKHWWRNVDVKHRCYCYAFIVLAQQQGTHSDQAAKADEDGHEGCRSGSSGKQDSHSAQRGKSGAVCRINGVPLRNVIVFEQGAAAIVYIQYDVHCRGPERAQGADLSPIPTLQKCSTTTTIIIKYTRTDLFIYKNKKKNRKNRKR